MSRNAISQQMPASWPQIIPHRQTCTSITAIHSRLPGLRSQRGSRLELITCSTSLQ